VKELKRLLVDKQSAKPNLSTPSVNFDKNER